MEDYREERTPESQRTDPIEQEAAARETVNAQRDHAAALNAAEAGRGDLQNDTDARNVAAEELWDAGDRRANLAKLLMDALGGTEEGRDGVRARLAADRDQGMPPIDAVRSTQRGPKARKNTGRAARRERGRGLG